MMKDRDLQAPWVGKADWDWFGWETEEEEEERELAYYEYIDRLIDERKEENSLEKRRMRMLNNPTKEEVIDALICLRDKIIEEEAEADMDSKMRWYIPDCLACAINFMEERDDE